MGNFYDFNFTWINWGGGKIGQYMDRMAELASKTTSTMFQIDMEENRTVSSEKAKESRVNRVNSSFVWYCVEFTRFSTIFRPVTNKQTIPG